MRQPFIHSPAVDGVFILGIPFFIVAIAFIFHAHFSLPDSMTVVTWAIFVLAIDVSHVYSTIYRTYADRETRNRHAAFLYMLPFAVLIICMALYAQGALVFWRVMAYLAVFHFARQQYGFMRVYSRDEKPSIWGRRIDALAIYSATFFPVIDWHLRGQKNFNWFMKGDFIYAQSISAGLLSVLWGAYLIIMALYVARAIHSRSLNLPKHLMIAGTALSWYVGIVFFNSDLAFTAINTASHGIPYVALVWIWGNKKRSAERVFQPRYVALFLFVLFFFGYVEEGFWSAWVWHDNEHRDLFQIFHQIFGDLEVNSPLLKLIVPLLSVPQITHYIIDGFIWKIRDDKYAWSDIIQPKADAPINKI